jgi:hypothetical protein
MSHRNSIRAQAKRHRAAMLGTALLEHSATWPEWTRLAVVSCTRPAALEAMAESLGLSRLIPEEAS